MANICVLGCGMVGSAMAIDLVKNHSVTVADKNKKALADTKEKADDLKTIAADLSDADAISDVIEDADLVVCAVPGFMGFNVLKTVLNNKKSAVDISFFPENALDLDYLAKKHEVYALVDCGVAPGMDNILLGHHDSTMKVQKFECLVGGLPRQRRWPFEYKAPFSPIDVIEEYTRPARFVENGKLVTRPPLTDCELVHFDKVGTLESFNTDGLRTLLQTMDHIPDMKEKTLRYPRHAEYIKVLAETGFFSEEPIEVGGVSVSPLDFTAKVLIDNWKLKRNESEFTVMRVTIEGEESGKTKRYVYNLYDETDTASATSSMARTTGFTATAAVNYLLENKPSESGIIAPEVFGAYDGACDYVLKYLNERNVQYKKEETTLSTERS
ncbi:saccharopine dehydrogenase family protein [Pleionea litopenaei]|uniref:Saccharopine dehydrogenase C-terminal domain-containing protein n=1 Tax=Pleionea litopenaei TaxID=3070815 RepID=A0AA51RV14_9GAMM|nr:saccharopine dehydrogenase C-terminal domain-containing protein [Pleionea sp. HL-JVS1]WMS88024.1 saccharopine dehydrogenase C-terminal domain-containing protein [Pleionea sp. HL-JVS1]